MLKHNLVYNAPQARVQEYRLHSQQFLHHIQNRRRSTPGHVRPTAHQRNESTVANGES